MAPLIDLTGSRSWIKVSHMVERTTKRYNDGEVLSGASTRGARPEERVKIEGLKRNYKAFLESGFVSTV